MCAGVVGYFEGGFGEALFWGGFVSEAWVWGGGEQLEAR